MQFTPKYSSLRAQQGFLKLILVYWLSSCLSLPVHRYVLKSLRLGSWLLCSGVSKARIWFYGYGVCCFLFGYLPCLSSLFSTSLKSSRAFEANFFSFVYRLFFCLFHASSPSFCFLPILAIRFLISSNLICYLVFTIFISARIHFFFALLFSFFPSPVSDVSGVKILHHVAAP